MDQRVAGDAGPLADDDVSQFVNGVHCRLYDKLGAHSLVVDGAAGAYFAVWAPNARQVSVIGDFNGWDGSRHRLSPLKDTGVWGGFIPGVGAGDVYKYRIFPLRNVRPLDKADPYGFYHETPPSTASIIWDLAYHWGDGGWIRERVKLNGLDRPIAIYEVHLGSWMRMAEERNRRLTYRELAPVLAEYVNRLGFTHVELMPLMEHPFYGSWGYQITGYFAPTSRYGTPQDFMYLVDYLHQHGIGVIMDWVAFHFPGDDHGLALFDGTDLYEHPDPRKGFYPEWSTFVFNYENKQVCSFLLSNALFWLELYHVDGLRLDALASMLYLDYLRKPEEWMPNKFGGPENLEAFEFVRILNGLVHERHPGALTIAEDSTGTSEVSTPLESGGLGFDLKWDLGWTHDIQEYMVCEPSKRRQHHRKLTFRPEYAFEQSFLLPLSHDEVKPGMGSLRSKLPGDDCEKLAGLRLLLGYMYAQPGKKLLFMGGEFGQWGEWNHNGALEWRLLDDPAHAGLQKFVSDLNHLYRGDPSLHERDCEASGFEWVYPDDAENSVLSFLRRGRSPDDVTLVVCNFAAVAHHNYRVGVPRGGFWRELLNSDATVYGGSGLGNFGGMEASPIPCHDHTQSLILTLPRLSVAFFQPDGDRT